MSCHTHFAMRRSPRQADRDGPARGSQYIETEPYGCDEEADRVDREVRNAEPEPDSEEPKDDRKHKAERGAGRELLRSRRRHYKKSEDEQCPGDLTDFGRRASQQH